MTKEGADFAGNVIVVNRHFPTQFKLWRSTNSTAIVLLFGNDVDCALGLQKLVKVAVALLRRGKSNAGGAAHGVVTGFTLAIRSIVSTYAL